MATQSIDKVQGLDRKTLLGIYRTMYLSRRIDDKEIQLKRQNRIFFQISGAGHEAILVAAGLALKPGHDWFYAYYRDRALMLQLGMTADRDAPVGRGGQGRPELGRPPDALALGPRRAERRHQVLAHRHPVPAGGRLRRGGRLRVRGPRRPRRRASACASRRTRSSTCSTGDGTTSEGEFWESLNTACNRKLPVLYLVEDNGYAISVPVEVQTPGGSISKLVRSFPDLLVREVDGCDPLASLEVMREAVAYCRARRGPGARARAGGAAVLALAVGRRDALPLRARARGRRPARPARALPEVPAGRGARDRGRAGDACGPRWTARSTRPRTRRWRRRSRRPRPPPITSTRRTSTRRRAALRDRAAARGRPEDDGRPAQRLPARRDGARPAHRRLRRGRRRLQPRGVARDGEGQGRRLQGHPQPAAPVRLAPRLQLAAGRGEHRRPRDRHGDPRPEAGGRDPVLRLHLARVHADAQRAGAHPLALERRLQVPGRRSA